MTITVMSTSPTIRRIAGKPIKPKHTRNKKEDLSAILQEMANIMTESADVLRTSAQVAKLQKKA